MPRRRPGVHCRSQVVSAPVARSPAGRVKSTPHGTHRLSSTRSSSPQTTVSQLVSGPLAGSPASFSVPAGHATQVFALTASFTAQKVVSQAVSAPEASSPAALVVPAGQATQVFALTASCRTEVASQVQPLRHVTGGRRPRWAGYAGVCTDASFTAQRVTSRVVSALRHVTGGIAYRWAATPAFELTFDREG